MLKTQKAMDRQMLFSYVVKVMVQSGQYQDSRVYPHLSEGLKFTMWDQQDTLEYKCSLVVPWLGKN